MGVQELVYFIEAVGHALKTSTLSALLWSFDWIPPKIGEIQSNDHGSARNDQVFKAWRRFEHPYFHIKLFNSDTYCYGTLLFGVVQK